MAAAAAAAATALGGGGARPPEAAWARGWQLLLQARLQRPQH